MWPFNPWRFSPSTSDSTVSSPFQSVACEQALLFGQAKPLRRSLARSCETRLTRPNRRACSQAIITLHFALPVFRTKQGVDTNEYNKNYKLGPTYPRHTIFSLRELHQTSPSALRAETSSRYQSDPPENQIWHTDEAGASLACYQSTLISGTSFFSQWYFPSSGRSTNENL